MRKPVALVACILVLLLLTTACSAGKDSYTHIPNEELTEEAVEAFSTLDGKHGVMVYHDESQFTNSQVTLYVVLYGPSGRAVSLNSSSKALTMTISGEPEQGFAVWRVTYKRNVFSNRQISFVQNGEPQVLDGLETLSFIVEANTL